MSDHLTPGSFSSLAQSNELAFRAKIGEGQIVPAGELYWRGLVLPICEHAMSWRAFETERPGAPRRQTAPGPDQAGNHAPSPGRAAGSLPSTGPCERQRLVKRAGAAFPEQRPAQSRLCPCSRQGDLHRLLGTDAGQRPTNPRRDGPPEVHSTCPRTSVARVPWPWRRVGSNKAHSEAEVIQAVDRFFRTGGYTYTLTPGRLPAHDAIDAFSVRTYAPGLLRTLRGGVQHAHARCGHSRPGGGRLPGRENTIIGAAITRSVSPTRTRGRRCSSRDGAGSARTRRAWWRPSA